MDAPIIAALVVLVVLLAAAAATANGGALVPERFRAGGKNPCYADMACGPARHCRAFFADDPTYGGRCVPA